MIDKSLKLPEGFELELDFERYVRDNIKIILKINKEYPFHFCSEFNIHRDIIHGRFPGELTLLTAYIFKHLKGVIFDFSDQYLKIKIDAEDTDVEEKLKILAEKTTFSRKYFQFEIEML